MKNLQPALLLLVAALLAVSSLTGCGLIANPPSLGSVAKAVNPLNWFGDDEPEQPVVPVAPRPDSAPVGTVHMVDRSNGFLLIRASRTTAIDHGTALIAQSRAGRQTAELKLSPERKGAFLVADIIKGNPDVGDVVKLVGASGLGADGIVPIGDDEVQVLE